MNIPANDKRRKELKKEFKDKTGLDPIIELSKQYISKSPKAYMSKYTHHLESMIIEYKTQLKSMIDDLKK